MKHDQVGQLEKLATLRKNIAFAKMQKAQNSVREKEQQKESAVNRHITKKAEARNIIDNHLQGTNADETQNYSSRLSRLRAKVSQAYQDIDDIRQSISRIDADIRLSLSVLEKDKSAFLETERKQKKIEILHTRLNEERAVIEASNQEADSIDSQLYNKK